MHKRTDLCALLKALKRKIMHPQYTTSTPCYISPLNLFTSQAGLCPGASDVQCCQGVQPFADRYWNCADVACTQTVASGSSQPNYECAEFVARALAAGGWISGLSGLEAQSSYDPYEYNGQSYDFLWVSNIQGGPLGLREFLLAKGWSGDASSSIVAGSAVMVSGSGGSYGHVALGVGDNVCDAHNNARYHATSCNTFYIVDQVLNPPSANECSENCVEYPVSNETYVPHYKRLAALGVNETQSPWG